MRVRGNLSPETVTVEKSITPGKSLVRVRENINEVALKDEMSGNEITQYEYDEYEFTVPEQKNLKKTIESNLEDWIATGKNAEVDPNSTLYVTAKADAVDAYTAELMEEGVL